MKINYLMIIFCCLSIFTACHDDESESYGQPNIRYINKHDWSDTITTGQFKEWITLLGDNFRHVKQVSINTIDLPLEDIFTKVDEITFQIPDSIPEVITNEIVVTTALGEAKKEFFVAFPEPVIVPERINSWNFDDPTNLFKSAVGNDLIPSLRKGGKNEIPTSDLSGFIAIDGPGKPEGNGAICVGRGYFLKTEHGMKPNLGGYKVNEYTLMVDFMIDELGKWHAFYNTNGTNSNDAEIFINASGAIGVGNTGYSSAVVKAGKWHRFVATIKLGNGGSFHYYLDGKEIHSVLDTTGDWRFQCNSSAFCLDSSFHLFADNDGEDEDINVAEVAVWDVALTAEEVEQLEKDMNKRK